MIKTDVFCDGEQVKEVPVLIEVIDAVDKDKTECRVDDVIYHIHEWGVKDGIREIYCGKERE